MAEKKSWRDYSKMYSTEETTEEESGNKKTGGWRDYSRAFSSEGTANSNPSSGLWRSYSNTDFAAIAGEDVVNRINNWLSSHNALLTKHQDRYFNRKFTYEDAYVSDSREWLDAVNQEHQRLSSEADSIVDYMYQNQSYLNADWMKEVINTLHKARADEGQLSTFATKDFQSWSRFMPDEEQAAAGYTADKLYKEWQDGQKQYAEDMAYDISAGELELEELKKEKEAYLADQEEKRKQAQSEESWLDKIVRWSGNSPDTTLPIVGSGGYSGDTSNTSGYDKLIAEKEEQIKRAKYVQGYEGYMDNMDADDYATGSQYVSTRTDVAKEDALWGLYKNQYDESKLFGDFLYDYINRNQDAMDVAMVNDTASNAYFLGLDKGFLKSMSDDEIGVYNYIYKTQGPDSANAFLSHIESDLEGRRRVQEQAFWAAYAKSDPVGSSVFSTLISPLKGLSYLGQAADMLDDGAMDQNAGYNRFSYIPSTIRSEVSNTIENSGKWGKVGSFAYNTGMSMADFLFTTAVSGGNQGLSLAIMGTGAAADATLAAKDRGLDDADAFALGTIAGLAEVAMEKISLGAWLDGDMTEGALRYVLKNAFSEGLEETGTSIVNLLADVIIAGDKSEWNMAIQAYIDEGKSPEEAFGLVAAEQAAQIGLDALGGMLSGFAIGGGTYAGTSAVAGFQYGKDGKNKSYTQKLVTEGVKLNPDSQYIQKMQSKVEKGKNLTGMQVRNILAANQEQITANDMKKIQTAAEARLTELGQTEDVQKLAELVTKYVTGQKMSKDEKAFLANNKNGNRTAQEALPDNVLSGDYTSGWAEGIGTKKVNALAYNIKSIVEQMAKMDSPATYKSLEERVGEEDQYTVSDTGKATIRKTGEAINLSKVEVADFVTDKKTGKITDMILKADGKEAKASEIDYADDSQSYLYEAVSKIENITPADATVIIRDYDPSSGQSVGEYLNGIDEAYTYGYYGYSDADLRAGNFAPKLTDTQMKSAYVLGQNARSNSDTDADAPIVKLRTAEEAKLTQEQKKAKQKAKIESEDAEVYFRDGKKVVKFDEHTGKYDKKRMAAVNTAKFLSKLGIGGKYYFYESYMKNGVRVYKDTNGKEVEAPNGVYMESDGSIHIDLNAGNAGQGTALFTLAHELTHFVKDQSKKQFKILNDLVAEAFDKTDISMHKRVLAKQKFLENKRGKVVSYAEAHEEVVADALSTMLSDGSFYDLIMEIKVKDKGLFATIKRFFKDMIAKFTKEYAKLTPDQQDAQDIRQMKDMFDKIQKVFAEALVEASDNFQATKAQKNTTEEGGVEEIKESIRRTQRMTLKDQLSAYYKKQFKRSDAFYFGITPIILSKSGLDAHPLAFAQDDFVKSTRNKHNIPRRVLNNLSENLRKPIYSFTAGKQAGIVIDDIDGDGKPVVVAIHGGHNMDRNPVNLIKSIYGVDSMKEWVAQQIEGGCKFRVYDIEKANAMLQTEGYLAEVGTQSDGFWDIITEKKTGVNTESTEAMDVEMDAAAKALDQIPEINDRENEDIRYSYRGVNKDGIEVYETSGDIKKLSYKDRQQKFLDIMTNDYRGRTAKFIRNGHTYYATFEEKDVNKNIYGDKRSDKKGYKAKINVGADGDIFELVENAQYNGSLPEKGKKITAHRGVGYWDYFIKNVQIDGTVFNLTANVRKKADGAFVYSIQLNENKKIKASPPLGLLSKALNGVTNASNKRITQPASKVNSQNSGTNSERGEDTSNRSLLANAFEGLSQSSVEYQMIQDYKEQIKVLNLLEEQLSDLNAEIREIRFTKGKYDAKKLQKLEEKAERMAKDINKQDKILLNMEASEPLRKIIAFERKKAAQETKEHIKEIQQNKKVRAEQTELRHKIRKTIRDLDKILNRGNKKQNVKEDMKGFVSKALELADYLFTDNISNDELIRRGITVRMTPKEAALVKETEDILSQIYDNADSLTDEEFTRLDSKRKSNLDKLRDLLTAQRNERLNTPVYNLFNDLVTEYARLKNSKQDAVKAAYNVDLERLLRQFMGDTTDGTDTDRKTLLQNMRVADMTTKELQKLLDAYKMVLTNVRDANKVFVMGKIDSIDKAAEKLTQDFSKRKIPDKKLAISVQKLINKIGWDYEKLYYALDRIGSETFAELIMNIANSENIVMQDVMEAAAFRDEMVERYGFNNWDVNKEIDREFLDNTGKKFKLTLGQLMALYAYSRREGAWDHIEYGGFVFGEAALTNPKPADSYKLSKVQCEAITNLLTKEQKSYAEDMQKYLSEEMGEKGNEVSMLLYGIKMFGEKNYFPIHIAGQFKAQANESQAKAAAGFSSMSNAGFTHAQNPNAKAPFVLEGFNEVWTDHVNEMSRYHGTVPALEDLRRVMNRSSYSETGMESMAIKQLMENSYGKEAVEYFDNLYREANSGAITDKLQKTSKKLLSMFRKNSVAYSLSVLIQQSASLVRAYAMVDRKYFGFKGFGTITSGVVKAVSDKWTKAHTSAYNEMLKYAPGVTMAKEIGGFDTHTGGSIRSYLLDTNKKFGQKWKTGTALEKGKAVLDLVDDNAIANLPNMADKIAWIEIWNACKRETVTTHKNLTPNSEEFMQAVGKRFTEVIRATQVYDSMFAKSPMLKSKNLAVQYLVSFMNEPNAVANMAEKAVRDAIKGDWKGGVKTAAVVIHSIVFTNVLKSIVYAMRDDDEDETYIEKYIEAVVGNMMDDFNALNYIPIARDVWSLAQGYDVERADMAIVADAIDSISKVVQNATENTEDMTEEQLAEFDNKATEANWKLVESIAAFFGIPVKNIRREIEGVIDHARIASANAGQTTAQSAWDKVYDAVVGSIPFMTAPSKQDKLYDAIISGDKAYLARIKSTYKTEDAYHSAVRKALRENDPRIKEAAQARYDGNTEEYKRIFREIQKEGNFSFDDIMSAINTELSKLTPDKVTSDYTASGYVEAIITGNLSNAKAMKYDIIATKIANGKTQEEAEKEFASNVSTGIRDAYTSGLLDDAGAEKMLIEYADKDEEEAASKVSYWAFCVEHPEYDLSESNVKDYREFAEPAEIPLDVFVQCINGTKGLTDIKDKWGDVEVTKREQVLEVIDSLPLTWEQKDALYLAAGYSESKIWDVPW